ncbi:MAG: hypothetical protein IJK29_10965 [Bacteroidales bacterium]|nr:hypothetical protein [Bacteroidales bacterium]
MVETFIRQELLDREMAPCATCDCCGAEIYSFDAYDEHGGLCEECWCAMFDEEADDEPA